MLDLSGEKILIIDDEKELADLVEMYLKAEDYIVQKANDGKDGLIKFNSFKPDMVVLDIKLPGVDGIDICKTIRMNSDIPILMLSAKTGDMDKILSLGFGADDYVTKPFSTNELIARIKAHLRRYGNSTKNHQKHILEFGDLQIDCMSYSVHVGGQAINLTAKEFELLSFLANHPNQVFTKEQLFDQVWGFEEFGDLNTITVHVRKIREKIEKDPSKPEFIKTVWSVGYKFEGRRK